MTSERRKRGTGWVYRRNERWWVQYSVNGKPQREPARLQRKNGLVEPVRTAEEAEKYLAGRLKKVHAHEEDPTKPFLTQRDRRRTINDLMDALLMDFKKRNKNTAQNRSLIKRAKADFGHFRALQLTAEDVDRYICDRLEPSDGTRPSKPASINRVTEVLSQAYTLAELPAPRIDSLPEKGNERKGFFAEQEIRSVISKLPADLADFTLYAWLTGWRKGEISALSWDDITGDCVFLAALDSKEREARSIPLEDELGELFERRKAARRIETEGSVKMVSHIFHTDGQPIGDFRKSWATACCAVGVGKLVCPKCRTDVSFEGKCASCGQTWTREDLKYVGRTFHDLRRSACRNMTNAGVPQTIAMAISGHKTDSMFRRYSITNENDKRTALRRTQEYLRTNTGEKAVVAMGEQAQFRHKTDTGGAAGSRK